MGSTEWLEGLKQMTIPQLTDTLGLTRRRLNTYSPCPLCGATTRSASDNRGPLGITWNQKGSHCHACNEDLDVVDLTAVVLMGKRVKEFASPEWTGFRTALEGRGLVTPESGSGRSRGSARVSSLGDSVARMLGKPSGRMPAAGGRKIRGITSASAPPGAGDGEASQGWKVRGAGGGGGGGERGFTWDPDLYAKTPDTLFQPEGSHVLAYLHSRGFSDTTIREWKIGAFLVRDGDRVVEEYLTIPLRDEHGRIVNYRFRSVPGPCLRCPADSLSAECPSCKGTGQVAKKYRPCTGRPLPLFGAHLLGTTRSLPVMVLEGELDVVAAWEYGYRENVVTGTAGAGTFKEEWLDILEPYDSFLLGHDGDGPGNEGAEKVATALGRYRCSRLILPEKDLGACLEKGIPAAQVERAVEMAKPMVGTSLEKANHYEGPLESLIENPEKLKGVPTASRKLNEKLAGLRPGLTVVTGDTGCGKTTWSTWIGWRLAKDHGIGVMVTSYEQKPVGTVQKLLRMELGEDFTKVPKERRLEALGSLGKMPLWILDHYGHMGFQDVLDSIRYARRRHGVQWFLVDHLGFLIPEDEDDDRKATEKVIRALALLANTEEVMIWLICHPSNSYVQERRRVMLKDLKGASAVRQDANEGIVIERGTITKKTPWCHSIVHLDKVRSEFGQSESSVILPFDPIALHYADSPSNLPTYKGGGMAVDPSSLPD